MTTATNETKQNGTAANKAERPRLQSSITVSNEIVRKWLARMLDEMDQHGLTVTSFRLSKDDVVIEAER